MGHRLANHGGKCKHLHGHNYLIRVNVGGMIDVDTGMVIDFHDLKTIVRDVLSRFDHAFVISTSDPLFEQLTALPNSNIIGIADAPPTAENLAILWGHNIAEKVRDLLGPVSVSINVRETEDCDVTYAVPNR